MHRAALIELPKTLSEQLHGLIGENGGQAAINRAGVPGGDEPIFLTICSMALCRTSGSFS